MLNRLSAIAGGGMRSVKIRCRSHHRFHAARDKTADPRCQLRSMLCVCLMITHRVHLAERVQELLHSKCEVPHGAQASHVQYDGLCQDGLASCH